MLHGENQIMAKTNYQEWFPTTFDDYTPRLELRDEKERDIMDLKGSWTRVVQYMSIYEPIWYFLLYYQFSERVLVISLEFRGSIVLYF